MSLSFPRLEGLRAGRSGTVGDLPHVRPEYSILGKVNWHGILPHCPKGTEEVDCPNPRQ
jgi:hypothetical protein